MNYTEHLRSTHHMMPANFELVRELGPEYARGILRAAACDELPYEWRIDPVPGWPQDDYPKAVVVALPAPGFVALIFFTGKARDGSAQIKATELWKKLSDLKEPGRCKPTTR